MLFTSLNFVAHPIQTIRNSGFNSVYDTDFVPPIPTKTVSIQEGDTIVITLVDGSNFKWELSPDFTLEDIQAFIPWVKSYSAIPTANGYKYKFTMMPKLSDDSRSSPNNPNLRYFFSCFAKMLMITENYSYSEQK